MNKGIEIARGKTKVLYENPGTAAINSSSRRPTRSPPATARGATRSRAKGRLAAQTTARVFRLLNLCGLADALSQRRRRRRRQRDARAPLQHDSARSRRARRRGRLVREAQSRHCARRAAGAAHGRVLLQGRRQPRSADRARRRSSRASIATPQEIARDDRDRAPDVRDSRRTRGASATCCWSI